ncbi:MAG: Gfo/Idh/MocA family oxidoreductase [Elusimicrobiota bacterium]
MKNNDVYKRKLRGGMVGGGIGAFIGPVHRMAATMDGEAEYVAGALHVDPVIARESGEKLFFDPNRTYTDYRDMAEKEALLSNDNKIDFVTIVTPNFTHFDIAKTFLEAGFNVICEKPMCISLAQAKQLEIIVKKTRKVFALGHIYTGYPMVKHAKYMVTTGQLGTINKIVVEYPQGWLLPAIFTKGKAINWRMNPKTSGASCCVGDIGTHAENLARYITGLKIIELCADTTSFIPGHKLEDDANVLLRYDSGAKGILYASQISAGEENGLTIRVYGTKAGIEWHQQNPNYLTVKGTDGIYKTLSKGTGVLCDAAKAAGRLPAGHPDGFIESYANLYREAYKSIREEVSGKRFTIYDYPTVEDGVTGNAFIETVLASAGSKSKWVKMKK